MQNMSGKLRDITLCCIYKSSLKYTFASSFIALICANPSFIDIQLLLLTTNNQTWTKKYTKVVTFRLINEYDYILVTFDHFWSERHFEPVVVATKIGSNITELPYAI